MNIKNDPGVARTSTRIIVYAGAAGLIAAFCVGYSVTNNALGRMVFRAALKWGLISAVTVGALSIALVGLCGLLRGARLGRGFSYPFTTSLGAVAFLVLGALTRPGYPSEEPNHQGLIWFIGIALAVICGAALARSVSGYRLRARIGAAIGTAAMAPIGAYLTRMSLGGRIYNDMIWTFLIGTLTLIVCGGVLGAVAGAISCGPARRWRTMMSHPAYNGPGHGADVLVLFGGIRARSK